MPTLVSDDDVRVTTGTGDVVLFEAGVPREVPDRLTRDCKLSGCYPPGGMSILKDEEPEKEDPIIPALQDVFTEILGLGDPNLVTADQTPRKSEVKDRMGGTRFSNDQFDLAWETLNTDVENEASE